MTETAIPQTTDTAEKPNFDNSMTPGKIPSIDEAWKAALAETGPIDWDADTTAANAEAAAAEDPEKTPAETPKAKAKATEKVAPEEPEADEDESPGDPGPEEKVTTRDLLKARTQMRAREERGRRELAARQTQLDQHWQTQNAQLRAAAERLAPLSEALTMLQNGDADGFAAALCKGSGVDVKSWSDINTEMLRNMSTPLYKQHREMRQQIERERAEREQYVAQETQRRATVEKEQAVRDFKRGMLDELGEHDDEALSELATARPDLAEMMFGIQQSAVSDSGETLPTHVAAEKSLANVVREFKSWSAFFEKHAESPTIKKLLGTAQNGTRKTATSERADDHPSGKSQVAKTPERRGGHAPKTVSHTRGASAAATTPPKGQDAIQHFARIMQREMDQNPTGNWKAEVG